MSAHQEKSQKPVNETTSHQSESISAHAQVQFKDNRPQGLYQLKMQDVANRSSRGANVTRLQELANQNHRGVKHPIQRKANRTGLPDTLKTGMENLSGYSLDDVKVHYNSPKPAQLQAHAYAQGSQIHLGSGQEKHLPHEAWHVVQQKQGRVRPTTQLKSKVNINDDAGLEKEADVMGAKALQMRFQGNNTSSFPVNRPSNSGGTSAPLQRVVGELKEAKITAKMDQNWSAAYVKMNAIAAASIFGGVAKHSVVFWATSVGAAADAQEKAVLKQLYASTSLYVSTQAAQSGYAAGDSANFGEIGLPFDFSTTANHAYRIVIIFNLTMHSTVEEIYATFLHEWNIHAIPWMATAAAAANVGAGTNATRELDEHKTYANKSDAELIAYVTTLNLSAGEGAKVLAKLTADRNRYDKGTGAGP
ncbi:MAG: hypothetical protein ACI837_003256 [Crocinitomicaceae bacterium]|jgi:hypothetical protein